MNIKKRNHRGKGAGLMVQETEATRENTGNEMLNIKLGGYVAEVADRFGFKECKVKVSFFY